ncbi:MAG TPA: crossover junction endodeoxyribonuclease RuvC [Patescibacteria group bacterium]|nr:crossover junction endodeoxyribonuclease RuvC [Patescibacteria group bacterium]
MRKKREEEIVMGIDPGFGRMGFAAVRSKGLQWEAVDFGVMTTPISKDFGRRLASLAEDLQALFLELRPGLLAVEQLFVTKNQKTAMRVSEARGVVLLLAAQLGIPVVELTPNQVKSAVCGDGRADKAGVQRMVKRLFNLSKIPKPDDAADALAIALAGTECFVR